MFPLLDPFFGSRLSARAEEKEWGNLTVSPKALSLAHCAKVAQ